MNGSNYPLVKQFVLRVVVQKKKTSGGRSGIAVTSPGMFQLALTMKWIATGSAFGQPSVNGWLVVEVAGLIPFIGDSRVVSRGESDIIKSKADVASGFRKTPVGTACLELLKC